MCMILLVRWVKKRVPKRMMNKSMRLVFSHSRQTKWWSLHPISLLFFHHSKRLMGSRRSYVRAARVCDGNSCGMDVRRYLCRRQMLYSNLIDRSHTYDCKGCGCTTSDRRPFHSHRRPHIQFGPNFDLFTQEPRAMYVVWRVVSGAVVVGAVCFGVPYRARICVM